MFLFKLIQLNFPALQKGGRKGVKTKEMGKGKDDTCDKAQKVGKMPTNFISLSK